MTSAGKRRAYILANSKCATGSLGVVVHCGLLIYASGLAAGDYMPTTMIRSCQRSREWISSRRYGKPGEILPHANRAAHLSKVARKRSSSRFLSWALGFIEIGVGVSRKLTNSRPESFCSRMEKRRCRVDDKYLGLLKAFSLTKRKALGEVICVLR